MADIKPSEVTDLPPPIPSADTQAALGFTRQLKMVGWFEPLNLIKIAARVVVSMLFGQYADHREIQAALKKPKAYNYADNDDFWFDYVADLGDGWDSTYTLAKLLAEPTLSISDPQNNRYETTRGRLLVMGGDEVYPVASRDEYRNRTVGPYQSALPWVDPKKEPPHLFALPGNHDWYDGLRSFFRLFCQERWIGGWKTEQSRSYFALQLPHNWWFFAVDIQLGSDIDKPQLDYFDELIDRLKKGDRIIFGAPSPSWLMDSLTGKNDGENIKFMERRICNKKADIHLYIAGDLHHYARYSNSENSRHYMTAGGGGAFLHGTHMLPDEIEVVEEQKKSTYALGDKALFPDRETSKSLLQGNLLFFYKNYWMSLMFGLIAAVSCWVMQSESLSLGGNLLAKLSEVEIGFLMPLEAFCSYFDLMWSSPFSALSLMIYLGSLTAFCQPFPDKNKVKMYVGQVVVGVTHGLFQFGLMLTLLAFYMKINISLGIDYWPVLAFEILLLTGALAGMLMGLYLYLTNYFLDYHAEAAFSSNAIADYKNFVRFHINAKGELTIYPMGVKSVETEWQLNRAGCDGESWFVSKSGQPVQEYAHLIETPITINTQKG